MSANRHPAGLIAPGLLRLMVPAVGWPAWQVRNLRGDLESAVMGALLAVPQAIAFATLAGLPPQYGIYASVVPVIVAVMFGSSWHMVSGPNTAVSVMLGAALAPLATTGSEDYIRLALLLTLLVGSLQLGAGLVRLGSVLDFVSGTVIVAVTQVVGLTMIVAALAGMLGIEVGRGEGVPGQLWRILWGLGDTNPWTLAAGGLVVGVGLLGRWWWRRYALLVALLAGTAVVTAWTTWTGGDASHVPLLGPIPESAIRVSSPPFDPVATTALLGDALAIAFVGLMQSVVIARSLALKTGQVIDTNRECVGQGLANLIAPFCSAFAGSGSFNRSLTHLQLGAQTPLAILMSAALLAGLVWVAAPWLALIPRTAVAATLLLIGLGLIDLAAVRRLLLSRHEALIFLGAFGVSLVLGLTGGVLVGVMLSLAVYLAQTSRPNIHISSYLARDGRDVTAVGIDGNLFFGSVPAVEKSLPQPPTSTRGVLLINTDHLTYLDIPGAELLLRQAQRWRQAGHGAYVQVGQPAFIEALEASGLIPAVGRDCLIRRDRHHVMKAILHPYMSGKPSTTRIEEEHNVNHLAQKLHATTLLGPVPLHLLAALLERQPVLHAECGDIIVRPDEPLDDHLILLEGELEAQRTWSVLDGHDKSYTWTLKPDSADGGPAILTAAARNLRVRALTNVRYLRLDADSIDELLGWGAQLRNEAESEPLLRERMNLVRQIGIFHHLPLENVSEAFRRMRSVAYAAGDTVMREGERGDRYCVIESGEVEVIRTDPFTDETRVVDYMGTGDGFGEESLLQDGYRNATIRMLTPGRILELAREDFEALIRPAMLAEVSAAEAKAEIESGKAQLLDCRYDLEYQESRIPGARLIPLHRLRFLVGNLDPAARYIVYCRSGRRSKAAAFLLRERNFDIASLKGGIKDWPYAVDAEPIETTSIP